MEIKSSSDTRVFSRDIAKEMRDSFLDYSMSVIVSRALPDVYDGLKPVHRRILFASHNLGMFSDKPYKKSAMLVGEVMGKYHPHGDSAIYTSMVRMAQDFSYRYPLIQGQGNFGSIDGDEAAAMRYTEARMSKIAMEMLKDINKDTVDFMDNYNAELKEPVILPARIPQLLLNGSMGIAVGMATNIPPHNLNELVDATCAIIDNPDIDTITLINEYIFGPDFPTGGYILGRSGIKKAYLTGKGSVIMRAKTHIEPIKNNKSQIIVTEIPYNVNKSALVERIGQLARDKVIDGITDLRDESNREGIRIVIETRRDVSPEVLLNQLYRLTALQSSFGVNNIALVNGVPKLLTLKEMINYYLQHQINVIKRRVKFDLDKALEREHILLGFLAISGDNLDEAIKIIRSSLTDEIASSRLMERFNLSEIQTKAILSMQLRRLTGLEQEKIKNEYDELELAIADYRDILANHQRVLNIIKEYLNEIKEKFGDNRRSEILDSGYDMDDEDLIEKDDIVVTLTTNGYIKQTSIDTYRTQLRGGRGVKGMSVNEDDVIDTLITMSTHDYILFFTNFGKVYRLKGYQVPSSSRTSKGLPVINLLNLDKGEEVKTIFRVVPENEFKYVVLVTERGLIKKTLLSEYDRVQKNGKIAITLNEDDTLIQAIMTTGDNEILIAGSNAKAVRFHENDVRPSGRGSKGVIAISLDSKDKVVGMTSNFLGNLILSVTDHGFGKMTTIDDYRLTRRGSKGVTTMKITEKNGKLVAFKSVNGDEDALIVTNEGVIIRISLESVSQVSRNTQGVKLIKVSENAKVSSISVIVKSDEGDVSRETSEV